MPDDLYDRDILLWSEQQADLLRRLQAGERVNEAVDWPNLIDEVLSLGASEFRAFEGLLSQMMAHLLKMVAAPGSPSRNHWNVEFLVFRFGMLRRYLPSMRQRLDLEALYSVALKQANASLVDWPDRAPLPEHCPFTLAQLLDTSVEPDALVLAAANAV